METHAYGGGPGNVVIDSCIGCHLVWLDPAELKQMVEAEGRRESPTTDAGALDPESIEFPDWREKTKPDARSQSEYLAAMLVLFSS